VSEPWEIRQGSALALLRAMPEASVQTIVTSPPYWGLRDYGTGQWEGGEPDCAHAGRPKPRQDTSGADKRFGETRGKQPSKGAYSIPVRDVCGCGARRIDEQIGLEPTPEEYVARLVELFREATRVLRADGTLWLNLHERWFPAPAILLDFAEEYVPVNALPAPRSSEEIEQSREQARENVKAGLELIRKAALERGLVLPPSIPEGR
jgi:DNA modification methylase